MYEKGGGGLSESTLARPQRCVTIHPSQRYRVSEQKHLQRRSQPAQWTRCEACARVSKYEDMCVIRSIRGGGLDRPMFARAL